MITNKALNVVKLSKDYIAASANGGEVTLDLSSQFDWIYFIDMDVTWSSSYHITWLLNKDKDTTFYTTPYCDNNHVGVKADGYPYCSILYLVQQSANVFRFHNTWSDQSAKMTIRCVIGE